MKKLIMDKIYKFLTDTRTLQVRNIITIVLLVSVYQFITVKNVYTRIENTINYSFYFFIAYIIVWSTTLFPRSIDYKAKQEIITFRIDLNTLDKLGLTKHPRNNKESDKLINEALRLYIKEKTRD